MLLLAAGLPTLGGCRTRDFPAKPEKVVTRALLPILEARAGSTISLHLDTRRKSTKRLGAERASRRFWLRPTRYHGLAFVAPALDPASPAERGIAFNGAALAGSILAAALEGLLENAFEGAGMRKIKPGVSAAPGRAVR